MERLVIKDADGNPYYYDAERGLKLESYEVQPLQRTEVLERLHTYEDTSLTPPEIMELKERDTAKVPVDIDEEFDMYVCPSCNMAIGAMGDREEHKFCLNCGQRLKWRE